MDDYDRFFGCERGDVTPEEYLDNLRFSLSLSDSYISSEEPFASYRREAFEHAAKLSK